MEKRIITFKACGQSLQRVGGITTAASDTVNYFEAHFELDENWQSLDSVRAIWSNEDAAVPSLLVNGICQIPSEVLTNVSKLKVNLVGSIADNGVVTDRLTTFTCPAFGITVKVPIDGTDPQDVTPSQFELFIEAVHDEVEIVTGMTAEAETLPEGSEATASYSNGVLAFGIPQGRHGEDGYTPIKGVDYFDGEDGYTPIKGIDYSDGKDGKDGKDGVNGIDGIDGFSPTAKVVKVGDTATITITDKNGTTSAQISDGSGGSGTSDYSDLTNKPKINNVELNGNKTTSDLGLFSGSYNDLTNKPTIPTVPTKVSAFTNDAGYLTTETDPTVPSWAKAQSKPSYTASEVGAIALPSNPSTGAFLVWNGTAWVAQTLSTWQGGSY